MTYMNLLVCQYRVALKWRQMELEAITRHQSVSTGSTAETLEAQRKKTAKVNYLN